MEALCSFGTSVNFCRNTRRYSPQSRALQVKYSYISFLIFWIGDIKMNVLNWMVTTISGIYLPLTHSIYSNCGIIVSLHLCLGVRSKAAGSHDNPWTVKAHGFLLCNVFLALWHLQQACNEERDIVWTVIAVSKENGFGLNDLGSIPGRSRHFFLHHHTQTVLGAHASPAPLIWEVLCFLG
jgi:hypothetical protein